MLIRGKLGAICLAAAICGLCSCADAPEPEETGRSFKVPITTSSDDARAEYLLGRELSEELRLTDANVHFLRAIELDPNFAMAWMMVANTSATAPEYFAAMRKAVATIDGVSDGERMQIQAFEAGVNQEPEIQRSELEALVATYPNDERAHETLAMFLADQQEYGAAIKEYRAAIAINPGYSRPHNMLGYALRTIGDYCGAEEAFKCYTELVPNQPNPYDSYAELLMKMGRFEESIAKYERALKLDPHFVASYVGICNNLLFMGDFQGARKALEGLERAARNDGERRAVHTWSAVSYLHEDDFDRALQEVKNRHEIAIASDDRAAMANDMFLTGRILLAAGRPDAAREKFTTAVDLVYESDATVDIKETAQRNLLFNLARTALEKGELAEASEKAAAYRKAANDHGILAQIQRSHRLDAMVALAAGDYKTALFELANANQQNPEVMLLTARAFAAAQDLEATRQACRQVVDFNQISINLAFSRNTAIELMSRL